MDFVGWIVVGLLAGALSGAVVEKDPNGCLANTVVGILGGLLGGWFATEQLHMDSTRGFLGALLVAFLGAVVIRLILDALEGGDRRNRRRGDHHYPSPASPLAVARPPLAVARLTTSRRPPSSKARKSSGT
jgi:uncharacterized membrane protein YeaQ/YmgE (transglycosylase-associated protein family)